MRLAVIPARGGSKRIPRKNIRLFAGQPIIGHVIHRAIGCGLFDRTIVSTDDEEIAAVATGFGADVPFVRPIELSGDFVGTTEVIAHATRWARSEGLEPGVVCCIYPTAPFIDSEDLRLAVEALEAGEWAYAFAAAEFPSSIFRSFEALNGGGLRMVFPSHFHTRTQDLPVALRDAGQFYFGRPDAWLEGKLIFAAHSYPIIIPGWRAQDIDTECDWRLAELIWKATKL